MFHLNNFQIYAYSEKSFTIDRNCWHFMVSQITKSKRLGRSDSIYLSSYTGPISSDSSSTEMSFTFSLYGELSCLPPPCSLVWRLYKPKCETKPIQYMSCKQDKKHEKDGRKKYILNKIPITFMFDFIVRTFLRTFLRSPKWFLFFITRPQPWKLRQWKM